MAVLRAELFGFSRRQQESLVTTAMLNRSRMRLQRLSTSAVFPEPTGPPTPSRNTSALDIDLPRALDACVSYVSQNWPPTSFDSGRERRMEGMLVVMLRRTSLPGLLLCLSLPATALAHTGHATPSIVAGALHPLSGLDHLLAMLAVGLLAGCSAGRLRWGLPTSFVLAMVVGALIGASHVDVPFIELGIALSLVTFGAALVWKQTFGAPVLVAVTAGFALFHGHAHGTEMGADLSAASYGVGFVLATAALHAFGVVLAMRMVQSGQQLTLARWGGGAIAAVGVASLGVALVAPM
jgi:urease accessory protein